MTISFVYSDLNSSFKKDSSGDFSQALDNDAIKQSLKSLFSTRPGERRDDLEFGTDIHGLLFEPMDEITANLIVENSVLAIKRWEPRINVTSFNITMDKINQIYQLDVFYDIVDTNQTEQVFNFILKAR